VAFQGSIARGTWLPVPAPLRNRNSQPEERPDPRRTLFASIPSAGTARTPCRGGMAALPVGGHRLECRLYLFRAKSGSIPSPTTLCILAP
jgi:hypothetical protein